jgi:hypothetical protein
MAILFKYIRCRLRKKLHLSSNRHSDKSIPILHEDDGGQVGDQRD